MAKSKSPKHDKPVSERRLAANRPNAACSTGPRTPAGNARSAQNGRKHAFASTSYAAIRPKTPKPSPASARISLRSVNPSTPRNCSQDLSMVSALSKRGEYK
jgi:hypothetical protein